MKTTAKDVILLCKGWYDKEKYPTVLDALKQYYRVNYCDDMEDQLNERFILRVLLIEAMREIAKDNPDRMLGFVNRYLTCGEVLFIPDEKNNDYDYQMFYRIVHFLLSLKMSGNGVVEIDTSDYFSTEYFEDGCKYLRLIEDII